MGSNILWSIAAVTVAYASYRLFKRILEKIARRKGAAEKRLFYIEKVFEVLFAVAALIVIAFIWSVDIKGISVVASSVFAIIGVAMFAQWSILSNVTASIIIFFTFPARIGDKIRVIDGENSVEGIIQEISLFQIELKDSENHTILYPNNLLLQKPVVKL
ncbi:MAG: mechanosensitive ion channel family protein [Thiovulaceae bacterium]|nr:mechanosensitive ion channel family protein [Sulfurimonadaceae bacterium]